MPPSRRGSARNWRGYRRSGRRAPTSRFYPHIDPARHIAGFRAYLDRHPNPRPVLEWAIRWLETHIPEPLPPVLCHRDFRTGNYMLDLRPGAELTAILDWEFAGWGDPDEDIGWFCCKGWRFARLDREAGGIAERATFQRAYEAASGRRLEPERVRFWEVLANVRWAVIALQQSDRYLIQGARDLVTAIIGRRATECDLELLMLLDPDGARAIGARGIIGANRQDAGSPIRQHPRSAERRGPAGARTRTSSGARPAAAAAGAAPRAAARRDRDGDRRARGRGGRRAGRGNSGAAPGPLPAAGVPPAERAECKRTPEDDLLRRFAADLRIGAFDRCDLRVRIARAILWRLTILKLREGNPGFLAENGFGE